MDIPQEAGPNQPIDHAWLNRWTQEEVIQQNLLVPGGSGPAEDPDFTHIDLYNIDVPNDSIDPAKFGIGLNVGHALTAVSPLGQIDPLLTGLSVYATNLFNDWCTRQIIANAAPIGIINIPFRN